MTAAMISRPRALDAPNSSARCALLQIVPRSAFRDHPSAIDHHHAIRQRIRLLQVVRSQQNASPALHEVANDPPETTPGLDVQAHCRLVEE